MYRPTVHSDLAMGVFRFIFFIQNHNVMQEANHLCHSVFSVRKEISLSFRICDEYMRVIFCVCLPGIIKNSVNCHGVLFL